MQEVEGSSHDLRDNLAQDTHFVRVFGGRGEAQLLLKGAWSVGGAMRRGLVMGEVIVYA